VKKAIWIVTLVAAAVAVTTARRSKEKKAGAKKAIVKFDVIEHKASSIAATSPVVSIYSATKHRRGGDAQVQGQVRVRGRGYRNQPQRSRCGLRASMSRRTSPAGVTRVQAKFAAQWPEADEEVGRYFENV
jgi:hypothetical protein